MNTTRTVILHMTDLHFGCDGENPNSLIARQSSLGELVASALRVVSGRTVPNMAKQAPFCRISSSLRANHPRIV
jgi:hypothetical protein